MELQKGQKVTLCSYQDAKNSLYRYPPGVNERMRKVFGSTVTVKKSWERADDIFFKIEEDTWTYHINWIVDIGNTTRFSNKIMKMM